MATRMQQRRGTASQWTSADPILNAGEIGFESDTNKFKIGDGINHWVDLAYFVDQDSLNTSLGDYVETALLGAPNGVAQLNSSGLLVSSQIPNIDEITQDAINNALVAGTGLDKTYDDGANTITLDIDSTVATKTYADTAVSNHEADTTSVHGISDTAELATKAFAASLLTGATKSNITITGDKNGLTITAENGVADSTTTDLAEGTNLYFTDERAQDAVGNAVGTGLTYTDSTGEIKVTPNTYDAYGAASTAASNAATALSNHENDTTNIHGITDTSKLVTTDGTQTLTNKTITSPSGLVKADVGLDNVDNTSDANKPVSTATQTALDLKANLSGAAFSGAVSVTDTTQSTSTTSGAVKTSGGLGVAKNAYVGGNLVISGDFTVNGTTTTVNTANLNVTDAMIYMGDGNSANSIDLGIVSAFNDGTYQHTGLVRDASDGAWKLFKGVTDEPTTTVNFTQGSLDDLKVAGLTASSLTVGSVSNTEIGYLDGVTSAIQTQIDSKAPSASPTITGHATIEGVTATGATGTGKFVFDTSPTLVTPALGTPSSVTLTNATGLPVSTGISGLGTGIATALAVNTGSAGAPVLFNGALGTPSSGTLTNATGLPVSGITSSTTTALGLGSIELGHASDTTLSRSSAGVLAVEGVVVPTISSTNTLTNKTIDGASNTLTVRLANDISGFGTGVATFLGTPSSSNFASMITDEIGTGNILLSDMATNAQTASYTLVLGDKAKVVEMNVASANNLTIPTNANVAFPTGTQIHIVQTGAGQTTVVAPSGGTVNSATTLKLRTQWSAATLIKRATDTWVLVGDLATS